MERFRNVVIFGDSLSDIGTKRDSLFGVLGRGLGAMTVNDNGRFSDCRNWTDHMFEAATGDSLISADMNATRERSKSYTTFGKNEHCIGVTDQSWFNYANYAEGGACGKLKAKGCNQFKDQVDKFKTDFAAWKMKDITRRRQAGGGSSEADGAEPARTLVFVWFGANDVYTAGGAPSDMSGVANEIVNVQRDRIAEIVAGHAKLSRSPLVRFIFMGVPMPETSTRYQPEGSKSDIGEKKMTDLRRAVSTLNAHMKANLRSADDTFIDMNILLDPAVMEGFKSTLDLQSGHQEKPGFFSSAPVSSPRAETTALLKRKTAKVTTSDQAHPTDRVYKLMWSNIAAVLEQKGYGFGNIGRSGLTSAPTFSRPRLPGEIGAGGARARRSAEL